MRRAVICGAGGFVGSWLVKRLRKEGYWVRGVDIKYPDFDESVANEFLQLDLRRPWSCETAVMNMDDVYQLAADMGGIEFITTHLSDVARNNTLINLNMLEAAKNFKIKRYLYTSSACVYAQSKQQSDFKSLCALKEEDAWPADPEPGYGLEKLYSEEMTRYYAKDHGLNVRIVRFHNVYGPIGTYDGGREKAPAAICRKVARAIKEGQDSIEIWGDGQQVRSYMFIDDCIEGLRRIMDSSYGLPINLGTEEAVTIDEQAKLTMDIAGVNLKLVHDKTKPQGVRGRNSDNSLLRKVLNWEPRIMLKEGLKPTYEWIAEQVNKENALAMSEGNVSGRS